ncbi:Uu.00g038690.m01.CDS01 [Anthostomella pinea]|uniref:Uu.00g038690.m01.CDS01 n=1 Tax=Anthostomella pinea TaxID=933095 RepID=A0AAI8YDN8_9PEZI|nr:Uu.00g038690.m01.CDS01 [Anthostomella pinea]
MPSSTELRIAEADETKSSSANQKGAAGSSLAFSSVSQPNNSDWRNIPRKQRHRQPEFHGIDGNSKLKLAKPFTKKARRIIIKKTEKLMRRRDALDIAVLTAAEKTNPGPNDWLPRDKLLRSLEHLEKRERRLLRVRTNKLSDLERLYRWDPTADRAYDHDLSRKLLWKFKRNLGPLLDDYIKNPRNNDDDDDDDTSSSGSDSEPGDEVEEVTMSGDEVVGEGGNKRKRNEEEEESAGPLVKKPKKNARKEAKKEALEKAKEAKKAKKEARKNDPQTNDN